MPRCRQADLHLERLSSGQFDTNYRTGQKVRGTSRCGIAAPGLWSFELRLSVVSGEGSGEPLPLQGYIFLIITMSVEETFVFWFVGPLPSANSVPSKA